MVENLDYTNILLKGSAVKFFGVELIEYEEDYANENVTHIVELIRECFPDGLVPCDLLDMFDRLLEDPVKNLELSKDDPSLLLAKERRELMIYSHTEYMTNVKPELISGDDHLQKCNTFFMECPYLDSWIKKMSKNWYLSVVANYNPAFETKRLEDAGLEEGKEGEMGEFQFCIMRNCDVHIPENVRNDGITPFRLSWTDYIRTCYFPRYLSFIHRRMVQYKLTVA